MDSRAKVLSRTYKPSGSGSPLVGEMKFSGSPSDMSTIRGAGAAFVVNLDGRAVPTVRLVEDGVILGMMTDPTPHVVEFFVRGSSVFRRENVVFNATTPQAFTLSAQASPTTGTPATPTTQFMVTVRGQQQKPVRSFRVGTQTYAPIEMGTGTGVYSAQGVTLPVNVDSTVDVIHTDGSIEHAIVHPPANAREIELQLGASSSGTELATTTPASDCSIAPEILARLGLTADAICHGNIITMNTGDKYRVVIENGSAQLVLLPKEKSVIEEYALPVVLLAAGGGLIYYGIQSRKAAEAKAARAEAVSNPRKNK